MSGDSRLQVSDGHQKRRESALVQAIPPFQLQLVYDRHEEILREKQHRPVEPRRRNTDDGERVLVQSNRAANHAAVVLKVGVPIRVVEHDIRGAIRTSLIGCVKEPAQVRPYPKYVEVVPTRFIDKGASGIAARIQPCLSVVISCQAIKAAVSVAQVEVVSI